MGFIAFCKDEIALRIEDIDAKITLFFQFYINLVSRGVGVHGKRHFCSFRGLVKMGRQGDVVDPGTIRAAVNGVVLRIDPFIAVVSRCDGEGLLCPPKVTRPFVLFFSIDVEGEEVIVELARNPSVEGDVSWLRRGENQGELRGLAMVDVERLGTL